ncbi:hypothetical protein A7K93_04745 [Candidatus Methylacidiphilum fumarolicum]|uniref:Uncharacterized protein n=2 Tax=Candidatus Methylacidiphilum fumarolicum TaxID=591154 RepID=I0JZD0_METFB|nr:hypothetical protein [Candidatus Methylacidiphilum fumarolicum]CCG92599.1 hypothetical protein MFUM_700154 [Methylacidiphilum fumariolicum SolV]TFE70113.1 hypothetical protein A7K73_04330 [Candidatus Methylacidiphilum fumarolicum]TFE74318.1 hypothetical protein A7K93_04745 [Candidatus Methylacidiphilum fumarolicum]TFE75817.1 hypothetical protein A7K72_01425 [Candidatus Methylacidiphilum fumarolicum]TFE75978.1 hypothetical protein A7D33_01630 [Candidatus Methylacidiphilum fumarolicum]
MLIVFRYPFFLISFYFCFLQALILSAHLLTTNVPCSYPNCSSRWIHGKILQSSLLLSQLGLCPIETDRFIGWIEGTHKGIGNFVDFADDTLIIREKKASNPKTLKIHSSYPFIEAWVLCQIEDIGNMVAAVRSRNASGEDRRVEVFDLENGKLIKTESSQELAFGTKAWEQLLRADVDFLPFCIRHESSGKDDPVRVETKYNTKKTIITIILQSGQRTILENPGKCLEAKVARNGTVGWIRISKETDRSFVEIYKEGKIISRIFGKYQKLKNWYFEKEGRGIVLCSFAEETPLYYERYDLNNLRRIDSDEESLDQWTELKPWAKPLDAIGKNIFLPTFSYTEAHE